MLLKQVLKRTAFQVAPQWAADWNTYWWLRKKAAELNRRSTSCRTPADHLALLDEVGGFPACQQEAEILRLLDILGALRPRRALEIGTQSGGTLYLISRMCDPAALLLSIDIHYGPAQRRAFPRLAREQQRIVCLEADSQAPATRDRTERLLARQPLDFLFIDGDHSYAGVAADFQNFASLVRPGGVIAFHDIIPDSQMRHGVPSTNWAGEVPRFWSEIRGRYDIEEFIANPEGDGFGIGVIHWKGEFA
ncbi:MAG: class I SAM-dependent methyltransferase [Gemmataceae bacterium]|nr:class I SAM-dependent methyltransferase [Gemmataceae bacterium]